MVGHLVGKVAERISDAMVAEVFRGLRYMFFYKSLVDDLESEIQKVESEEVEMSDKASAARANGKIIYDDVLKWQSEMEELHRSAQEILETYENRSEWRCIQCLPIPNPVSRFRLGREAARKARMASQLTHMGKILLDREFAYLPKVDISFQDFSFHEFESRRVAYGKLWEQLVTQGSPLILGIYGMPGVGKTRIMEHLWKEAKEMNIFHKVARANVGGEKLDVIKLQNQIASHLDCNLESKDNMASRASQLRNSLLNGGKVLVLFDDVWGEIPLLDIGIPWGDGSNSMGCKIVMTSRGKDVCLRNKCKHPIEITLLTEVEAWELFKDTVGTSQIGYLQDESLARKVCCECAGNPLIIRAVGKALQYRSRHLWMDALYQLKNGAIENIAGVDPQIYAVAVENIPEIGPQIYASAVEIIPEVDSQIYDLVKLSIDGLEDDAKSCLFVCSLFPDDADIHIGKLIQLVRGLQLVPDGETKVCAMVDELRSASLLLDSREIHEIKLPDLIRDVARSIAAKDPKYAFFIARCGPRLPDNYGYGTLRLDMESDDIHFPDNLVCLDVHNLWLQCNGHLQQFSGGFFSMFVNLRFLLIQEGTFSSLEPQFSLRPLGKLRTLILDYCDVSIDQKNTSFFPNNLETLCIWNCNLPVPLDLPNLKHLRKLEIYSKCTVVMVQKSISRLCSLEELHIRNGFQFNDGSNVMATLLVEISQLTRLKSLQTFFSDSEPFQHSNIFGNLHEYDICVGKPEEGICYLLHSSVLVKRRIELYSNQLEVYSNQLEVWKSLIERAEEVKLRCNDINASSIFSNTEAFIDLRNLYIEECNTMEYLARISEDNIQHSHLQQTSFCRLTTLGIYGCSAMEYLFSNSVANCLVQLKELCIDNCPKMKAIILDEGTGGEGEIINFSKLKSLKLVGLPKLTSFYGHNYVQFQPLFDGLVVFPSLEELHIEDLEDMSDIWAKHEYEDHVSFSKLKRLKVSECNKLEIVIPPAMFQRLQYLESLSIDCCDSVIAEVGTYGSNIDVFPLKALLALELESLPRLTETKLNSREDSGTMTWYPNLENLRICYCNGLRNVFLPSTARELVHLKKMRIVGCKKMTEIIGVGKKEITAGITFSKMTDLELTRLPNLTSLWSYKKDDYKVEIPKVNSKVLNCAKLAWKR